MPSLAPMRWDTGAIGGFFEDLPVLAFVLAGTLSVACTASWASGFMSEEERLEALERAASDLVTSVRLELQELGSVPTAESVRQANLSGSIETLPEGTQCLVSLWCVHPMNECLLTEASGACEPEVACSDSAFMNMLCDQGFVGVLEVRVLVWEAPP